MTLREFAIKWMPEQQGHSEDVEFITDLQNAAMSEHSFKGWWTFHDVVIRYPDYVKKLRNGTKQR